MSTDTPIVIPTGSVLELAFGPEVRGQVMKHVDAYFDAAAAAASGKFGELVREAQMAEIDAARLFHCANDEEQRALALGIFYANDWRGRVLKKWVERSKEALERSKEAIKRAKEARDELIRMIEFVGPTAK